MRALISCCMKHALSAAITFASLGIQPAHALILGEIEVASRVGEPLLAYVPVSLDSPDEKISETCLSIIKAGISPEQEISNLSAARLELEGNRNIDQRIRISTAAPVKEPSLTLLLKANCVVNGLVIREFHLELEPAAGSFLQPEGSSSPPAEKAEESAGQKPEEKAFLQKPDLNGSVRAGYFSSSRKLDAKKDLGAGSVWLKATQNFGNDLSLVARGWVRNDESFRASGGSAKLQEGYLKFSAGKADYRIGKQIIVWGRADRLNPTDNLTPRNFTLLTPEDDDQRIGSLAAKISYNSAES